MKNAKPLLWWLWVLLQAGVVAAMPEAAPPDYKTAYTLEDQWVVYDDSYSGYVPYFRRRYGVQPTVSLILDLKKYRQYHLLLQVPQQTHIFVQSRLSQTLPASGTLVLDIDSLQRTYKANSVLLTLYRPDGHIDLPSAQVVYASQSVAKAAPSASVAIGTTQPKLRVASGFRDFATLAAIVLLVAYTFLLNYYPKAFQRNFSFQSIVALDLRGDATFLAKPLNQVNLLFIAAHSMLLSVFYMVGQRYSGSFFVNLLPFEASDAFYGLWVYFMALTAVVFVLLVAKYLFIYGMGVVFDMDNTASPHYYEYLIFSRLFFLVAVLLQFIVLITYPQWLLPLMPWVLASLVVLNIVRILTIGSVLNKLTAFRNLYLFSYLCATEVIPLLVGVKLLAK